MSEEQDELTPREHDEMRDLVLSGAQRIEHSRVRRMRISAVVVALVLVGAVTGAVISGALAPIARIASTPTSSTIPTPASTPGPVAAATYDCRGLSIPGEALVGPRPATDIGVEDAGALAVLGPDDGAATDWTIGSESADQVVLLQALEPPYDAGTGGPVIDHYALVLVRKDAGWVRDRMEECSLAMELGNLTVPDVRLDPAWKTDPASREVHMLVTEQQCNGGADATGRVRLVHLDETSSTVSVVLGVAPETGLHTCPSNRPTPFVVTLTDPIGDRTIWNGALGDPAEIPEGTR